LKDSGFYSDGDGLYLKITASGNKTWHFRFKLAKRAREMGLGSYPTVSLKEAREEAQEARKLLGKGVDPIEQRKAERALLQAPAAPSFEEMTEEYLKAHGREWKNAKHRRQWKTTLENYAFPVIGKMPVDQIEQADVLKVLNPIWNTKTDTASRVRQRIESVLDAAIAKKHRKTSNPALWRGNLKLLLPNPKKTVKVKHHPALDYVQMPDFMVELQEIETVSAKALIFTILTASRTNEVLQARWPEVDMSLALWTIPASHMKTEEEHRVPLSKAAVEVLEPLYEVRERDDSLIFPGSKTGKPISNTAMWRTLKDIRPDLTVHGFRSTFRDWAGDTTSFHPDICEAALAHVITNKSRAAYERSDKLQKRQKLMEAWAGYCFGSSQSAKVLTLRDTG
jgi:integrase